MYKVVSNGELVYSDTLVYVRLHDNGSYVGCSYDKADGFCVKVPYINEEGESLIVSRVYALPEHTLRSNEPTGEAEFISCHEVTERFLSE